DRERLRLDRRMKGGDQLANGTFAGRTGGQFRSAGWPAQRELSPADDTIAVANFVFVERHRVKMLVGLRLALCEPVFQLALCSLRASGCRREFADLSLFSLKQRQESFHLIGKPS